LIPAKFLFSLQFLQSQRARSVGERQFTMIKHSGNPSDDYFFFAFGNGSALFFRWSGISARMSRKKISGYSKPWPRTRLAMAMRQTSPLEQAGA
jgi:hypothetical protein